MTKTADKETANVGDKITYTVKVGNGDGAVYELSLIHIFDSYCNYLKKKGIIVSDEQLEICAYGLELILSLIHI